MKNPSVPELKVLAKQQGINGYNKMRKAELMEKLGIENELYNYKCQHDRVKYYCKECKGSQICVHNQQRTRCKECKGSQICVHDRAKYLCKECGGKGLCIHDRVK